MKKFNLKILGKNSSFEKEVSELIVNSQTGYLTILANHIPIITTIKRGKIEWKDEGIKESLITSEGIMKVDGKEVCVFADILEE